MMSPDSPPDSPFGRLRRDRRRFLTVAARAGLGLAGLAALPAPARAALRGLWAAAPDPDLIERNVWPEHWETSLAALDRSLLTANDVFFVRSHHTVPEVDAASWKLEVVGLVARPVAFTLAELKRLPRIERVATLECAGNGRGLYVLPSTAGTQWQYGAVGTARWAGCRMSDVIDRAGLQAGVKHVWLEAADAAPLGTAPPFLRSIPFDKAWRDALLIYEMNGAPLPRRHGAPLRALVPGWYGAAWTKWLTRLRLAEAPSDNHFMAKGYRWIYPGDDPAAAPPVEAMRVKSLITAPRVGDTVKAGWLRVAGFAWSGNAGIASVEVSSDDGASWRHARLAGDAAPGAWVRWESDVDAAPGAEIALCARATDTAGESQPEAARPNGAGYGNNSIMKVKVRAAG